MAKIISSHNQPSPSLIISMLWRGKNVIISTVFLFLVIGGGYLIFANERWVSKATITYPSSGQIANYNAILSIVYADDFSDKPSINDLQHQVFNRFSSSLNALSSSLAALEEPLTLRVDAINKGSDDFLSVSFISSSAKKSQEELLKYLNKVNNEVIKEIGDDITYNVGVKTNSLKNTVALNEQIAIDKKNLRLDVINQALKIANATGQNKSPLNQAEYLSDDTLYLLGSDALRSMIANETTKPLAYDDSYYNAKRALLGVTHLKINMDNVKTFRFISNPDLPLKRISPQKSLVVILSIILGFIVGCVIVLLKGFSIKKQY
ncbi:LPS O-antigen chain length determinant protein WzzB [Pantoea wallisii]|nr:LPS O-antigen chain length determinant protein WzzB [Pantoea wallisii]